MKKGVIGAGLILFFVIFIGYSLSSYAMPYSMSNILMIPMTKWWEFPSILSKLNLNEKEKEALNKLLMESKSKIIDLKAKLKKERLRLEDMLESKNLDENAISKKIDLISKIKSEILATKLNYVLGIRKLLGLNRFELLKESLMMTKGMMKKRFFKHKHHYYNKHGKKWSE